MTNLVVPKSPNLPIGPVEYDRRYQDQFNNTLRLYFERLDNTFAALLQQNGGRYLSFPYGAFSDYTSQTAAANTATVIKFNTTDYSNEVTVVTSGGLATRITPTYAGLYNLQWSGQFENTAVQDHDVSVWLRKNGTDVVGSTGYISVPAKHGGVDGHIISAWNYLLQFQASDYVELWWSTDSTSVTIPTYAAGTTPTRPTTASVIATLTFVSAV